MYGWMGGWMDGWMGGWMDRWMDGMDGGDVMGIERREMRGESEIDVMRGGVE